MALFTRARRIRHGIPTLPAKLKNKGQLLSKNGAPRPIVGVETGHAAFSEAEAINRSVELAFAQVVPGSRPGLPLLRA
jgi:hypothetical protein